MSDNEIKIYSENEVSKKWGITRETLRLYKEKGYIEPEQPTYKVLYSKKDIQRIIYIKMLIDIGYSHLDIIKIARNEIDFKESIVNKISKLELEKEKIESLLGVVEMIKFTGEIPICKCNDIEKLTYNDFIKKVKEEWNLNDLKDKILIKEKSNDILSNYCNWMCDEISIDNEINLNLLRIYTLQMYNKIINEADIIEIKKAIKNRYIFEYKICEKILKEVSFRAFLRIKVKQLYSEGDVVLDEMYRLGSEKFKIFRKLVKDFYEEQKC